MSKILSLREYGGYFLIPKFFPKRLLKFLSPKLKRKIRFDELILILQYFSDKKPGTMIDVGAQFGESLAPFLYLNWDIYAFEPDPDNRKRKSLDRFNHNSNFHLEEKAVSNSTGEKVTFYGSEESTGVSSLLSFTKDHHPVSEVVTISLNDFLKSQNISHVEFLKIDVEGFDYHVLEGFPWESDKPDIILVEFDDSKTEILNINHKDIGDLLISQGYNTYISEWSPLQQYGSSSDWLAVTKYPGQLLNKNGWGNFLAFKDNEFEKFLTKKLTHSPVKFYN